jgi:HK97 family phage portal protein
MALLERIENRMARRLTPAPQANSSPFGGSDGDLAIVDFTPEVVETIRLSAASVAYDALYRTQPAVRTCVSFLASSIAPLNLKVYRRSAGDDAPEHLRDHPLQLLLDRPNDRTPRFDMMRDTVSDLAIYANAFWLKQTVGQQRRLLRLPPSFVQPRGGDVFTGASAYIVTSPTTGKYLTFQPEDIIHFVGYNPIDSRIGVSPLEALRYVLNEDSEASRHRARFWKNSAQRDGVIERPPEEESGVWDDKDRERFRADWSNRHTGTANAGDTPVLEDGMKWNPSSFSPKDSEFIEGREFTLDTAATVYHIPLAILSRKGTATFASMKEFRKMLYVDTLGPWNAAMEGVVNLQLVPDFGDPDLYVEFNIDEKLQGDFEEQTVAARQSVQVPWMSVDDMRGKRGMPPLGGIYAEPARPANYRYGDEDAIDQQMSASAEQIDLELAALSENGYHGPGEAP